MTIVYLYTALCTVGGADRSIIQKANYLADEMHQDVFIITDSQKERPPVFPISPKVVSWAAIKMDIKTDRPRFWASWFYPQSAGGICAAGNLLP